jgi:heterotetrameric sarcosine oxidase gamma subunit
MADHQLPLQGKTSDGKSVSVQELPAGFISQLAGWESFVTAGSTVLRTLGIGFPENYRTPWRSKSAAVWRIAPDRVLIRSDEPLAIASTGELAVLDLSQAKFRLRLEGPGSAGLLARLAALDFSEASFPTGSFAQTGMHHIGVLVDRLDEDKFEILIPTTWATSLIELIGAHLH